MVRAQSAGLLERGKFGENKIVNVAGDKTQQRRGRCPAAITPVLRRDIANETSGQSGDLHFTGGEPKPGGHAAEGHQRQRRGDRKHVEMVDEHEADHHHDKIPNAGHGRPAGVHLGVACAAHQPQKKREGAGNGKAVERPGKIVLPVHRKKHTGGEQKQTCQKRDDHMPAGQRRDIARVWIYSDPGQRRAWARSAWRCE